MKNVNELRTELSSLYADLRSGKIDRKEVSELTNIASKMISSAMTQVSYYHQRNEAPNIAFLNEGN
jgi:hypothetical protein